MPKLDRMPLYASAITFQWLVVCVILWRTIAQRFSLQQLRMSLPRPAFTIILFFANKMFSLRCPTSGPVEQLRTLVHLVAKILPQDSTGSLAIVTRGQLRRVTSLIFRGFVQSVFYDLTGLTPVGITLFAIFSALAHLHQGWHGFASALVVGVVSANVRSWTGSLTPCIVSHFVAAVTMGYVGLVGPIRLRRASDNGPRLHYSPNIVSQ